MNNVFYFQFPKLATVCCMKIGPSMYRMSVAYCHPNDEFNKETGRELALERMQCGEFTTFWVKLPFEFNKTDIKKRVSNILTLLTDNSDYRAWTYQK